MQRGPLLQPLRSTENILSGPPRARRLAGLSTGRLTAARTASASAASFFSHLSHSTERGKPPLAGPLSPRRIRLTPFPHGCHGFCCSFVAAQTTPAPSVSQSHVRGGSLQSRARRKPEPGIPDKGFLWAQLFRSREQPIPCRRYLNAPPAEVAATRLRRSGSPAGHGFPIIGTQLDFSSPRVFHSVCRWPCQRTRFFGIPDCIYDTGFFYSIAR
jgi:hypothetical protein